MTVMVIGLLTVPLATHVAKSPCALHEPMVPAFAAPLAMSIPPRASNAVDPMLTATQRSLSIGVSFSAHLLACQRRGSGVLRTQAVDT